MDLQADGEQSEQVHHDRSDSQGGAVSGVFGEAEVEVNHPEQDGNGDGEGCQARVKDERLNRAPVIQIEDEQSQDGESYHHAGEEL